jgi:hypothetical protein
MKCGSLQVHLKKYNLSKVVKLQQSGNPYNSEAIAIVDLTMGSAPNYLEYGIRKIPVNKAVAIIGSVWGR